MMGVGARFGRILPLWRWLPVVVWMALIFYLSSQPKEDLPSFGWLDLLVKKTAHFSAYAILALLCYRASGRVSWSLLITVAYAVTDEYHQTFVLNRHGAPIDVAIDAFGGWLALRWQQMRLRARRAAPERGESD